MKEKVKMPRPRVDAVLERLVRRLKNDEGMSIRQIANHVRIPKSTVSDILLRPNIIRPINQGGRPRKTDNR